MFQLLHPQQNNWNMWNIENLAEICQNSAFCSKSATIEKRFCQNAQLRLAASVAVVVCFIEYCCSLHWLLVPKGQGQKCITPCIAQSVA